MAAGCGQGKQACASGGAGIWLQGVGRASKHARQVVRAWLQGVGRGQASMRVRWCGHMAAGYGQRASKHARQVWGYGATLLQTLRPLIRAVHISKQNKEAAARRQAPTRAAL